MLNRCRVAVVAVLSVVSLGAQAPAKNAADTVEARAARIHKQALVVDTHIDTPLMLEKPGWDFMARHTPGPAPDENHVDLPRLREGGLDAAFFSIWMAGTVTGPEAVKRALILIDHVRSLAEQHPNDIVLATTAAEVRAAHKAGKFAALMGMEGGHMIDDSLAVLRDYHRLGVRYLTLSHSVNTNWADSSGDKPAHNGLTAFGKDVVRELNRLGVMVDISHVADKTFWDALETSKAPLVASHSSMRAISGHARNMTDDMIRALGAKGGVVMINYSVGFLSNERYEAQLKNVPAAELPGPTHVALGSDFDGTSVPDGMEDVSKLPKITAALLAKGYSEQDVKNILGENILRLLERVDAVGKEIRAGR
jgi:membrane dipeptidase